MSNLKHIGKTVLNHDLEVRRGDISGSNASTGSVGRIEVSGTGSFGRIEATVLDPKGLPTGTVSGSTQTKENLPVGVISGSAQITSGSGGLMSGSVQTKENLPRGVISGSAQITSGSVGLVSGSAQTIAHLPTGTISASMGISGSVTSTGSFGKLEVAGNSSLTGDLTIGGNITIGDADTDSLTISADLTSNLIPNADSTYNIGSTSKNWKFGYIEQLSATHVTASGNISGSASSTGSFAQILVGGSDGSNAFAVVSASKASGNIQISGSIQSTGSFGRVEATRLKGDGSELTNIAALPFVKTGSYYSDNDSDIYITGSLYVTGAVSASAIDAGYGQKHIHTQSTAATTWTVTHNFGEQFVNVDVYNASNQIVIPQSITATDGNTITVTFPTVTAGYAVVSTGGQHGPGAGKNYKHSQTSTATNWSVTHSLGEQYPTVTVWDKEDNVIVPDQIIARDASKADIIFAELQSGYAMFSVGGSATGMFTFTGSVASVANDVTITGSLRATNYGDNVSGSSTSTGSFGYLNVDGDAVIGGNLTFGDADTDSVSFSAEINSNIVPDADSTYNIGSTSKNWKFGHIEQLSATHVTASGNISGSATTTGSFGKLVIGGTTEPVFQVISGSNAVSTVSGSILISGSALSTGSFGKLVVATEINPGALPTGVMSGSAQTKENLPAGVISGSAGLSGSLPRGVISGSAQITSGSAGLMSGSAQTKENLPPGVISGSGNLSASLPPGTMSGSVQTKANLPRGVVSSSAQITSGSVGLVSGSAQTKANLPRGVVSSSAQITSGSGGLMSGSVQTKENLPRGVVSSSAQITSGSAGLMSGSVQTKENLPTGTVSASMGVSGSSTSTGSFGKVIVSEMGNSDLTNVSSSIASRTTTIEGSGTIQGVGTTNAVTFATVDTGQGANELYDMDQNVLTTSNVTFADVTATGTVTAQEFHSEFVSSSILFTSGSTIFGNTGDDVAKFSGSLIINSGSDGIDMLVISSSGVISGSAITTGSFSELRIAKTGSFGRLEATVVAPKGLPTGTVSGSAQTKENLPRGVVSSSAQITSGSAGLMSGSVQTKENLPTGVISGSAQMTSGSVGLMSGSVQTKENLPRGVVSSSAQITSGSVGLMSGSIQTKENLPTGTISASMGISGSATSTGSFGRTETTTLNLSSINGNWTNAGNTVADLGSITTVDINGGTINGITDLAVADGGTGASTLTDGGVLLGSGTSAITAMSVLADSEMIVGDGSTDPVAESGATLRTSIGVGTTDNVLFAAISASGDISGSSTSTGSFGKLEVAGNSSLTGDLTIGGNITIGDADSDSLTISADLTSNIVPNADSTYNIGSTSKNWKFGYIEQLSATHITASANISASGTITANQYGGNISGSSLSTGSFGRTETTTLNLSSINGNWTNVGNTVADGGTFTTIDINGGTINGITDLAVADGGTGASTLTDGGVLLGSGTGAITAMSVLADSEMIVGDGSTDPVAESGATLRTSIGVGTTDNVLFAAVSASGDISGSSTSTGSFGRVEGSTLQGTIVTPSQTNITSVGTIGTGVWNSTFGAASNTTISGSLGTNASLIRTLTAAGVSGSFTTVSSSLASRLTSEEGEAEGSVVSSSAQIASDISGSFSKEHLGSKVANVVTSSAQIASDISGSLGSNASLIRTLTAASISGSYEGGGSTKISGSSTSTGSFGKLIVATDINPGALPTGTMSGSAQTKENLPTGVISGSGNLSASLPPGTMSGSAQTKENLPRGVISGSAQITSGSVGLVSGSAQTIAHLPTGTVSASMGVSGSALSTGSFGYVIGVSTGSFQGVSVTNKLSAGTLSITGDATVDGNATVGGTLTAQEFHTEFVSSSVLLTSGSTIFGNTGDDVAKFSGSLLVNSASNNILVVSSSGRVGIGTFNPSAGTGNARLHVYGDILVESGSAKTMISGSSTSTGSFGRLEAKKISGSFIGDGTFNNIDDPVAMAIALG